MSIRVALQHSTRYQFDRAVTLTPHEIRLRPAPHCRTHILAYSLQIEPKRHFLNWQQDPYGNYIARLVFPEPTKSLSVTVDLVAEMTVINPFDFFVEPSASFFPFVYEPLLAEELTSFLAVPSPTPRLAALLETIKENHIKSGMRTTDVLVAVNRAIFQCTRYLVRLQAGVQTPEETLSLGSGSCRDSSWLLIHLLRHLGIAARFASGYLIQLKADVAALDGASGPESDFTDLHAWAEAYLPGAGWVGLDPTSGLLAGEGHIPLACTATPQSAAPISGATEVCSVDFSVTMNVSRLHEDPRVTKPFSAAQWQAIDALGAQVDRALSAQDVRLTQGGEPTFVSIDDMAGEEWNYSALSAKKLALAQQLSTRLAEHFAHDYLLHTGQGKWYPGEALPRWALNVYWRSDGKPLWRQRELLLQAATTQEAGKATLGDAEALMQRLLPRLGLSAEYVITAYEDIPALLLEESKLPTNFDPLQQELASSTERARLARLLAAGLDKPAGYVLPLRARAVANKGKAQSKRRRAEAAPESERSVASDKASWQSSRWPLRRARLYLIGGDSPIGLRLPLNTLPWVLPADEEVDFPVDPFAARPPLPEVAAMPDSALPPPALVNHEIVKTALTLEVRDGHLHVFLPPCQRLEDYVALLGALESALLEQKQVVVIEGAPPPRDPRLQHFAITPDPGVIEVNIHPAASWSELTERTRTLYEAARLTRLGTDKFMLDGRHTGTGGGNHVTLGGATAADSPLLRRPDLLRSLLTYWQNHPALSYLFSGNFIGPTGQAPRVDEARDDRLYELEIAFQQLQQHCVPGSEHPQPWLVDRLLRHLLTDLTGNTHRAEFCIDKLYSPDSSTGRLGLLEFRAFEMPPHWQMSALQMLLIRALVARFWQNPYAAKLIPWGTALHDKFMLPHFVAQDLAEVLADLRASTYHFDDAWFDAFIEFRFPCYGRISQAGITLELRQAIEPWHVLGEEISLSGTSRYVDSSVERLQLKVSGLDNIEQQNKARYLVTCNGRCVPLSATQVPGEYVAGIRFRAWNPPSALHPTIAVQAPLVFDLLDTWNDKSLGACTYHVTHPGGRSYDTFPVNANEAEARRQARFSAIAHTPGKLKAKPEPLNPAYPYTLDLRWQAQQPPPKSKG
ncbi:MAG: transglutaminase family protein [Pseudomonadota bacterium]